MSVRVKIGPLSILAPSIVEYRARRDGVWGAWIAWCFYRGSRKRAKQYVNEKLPDKIAMLKKRHRVKKIDVQVRVDGVLLHSGKGELDGPV